MKSTFEGIQSGSSIEDRVDEIRKNLQVYNGIQTKLIKRKHASSSHHEEATGILGEAMSWVDTYSPEYETAFEDVVRESIEQNADFMANFESHPDEAINEIEGRVEQYHMLEVKLMNHIDPGGKIPKDFSEWHSEFGKPLMKIVHSNPELFQRYLEAQDKAPDVQEEVLRELEDELYTHGS